jgi:hypothetical protein
MRAKHQWVVLFACAVVGWALCGATMGIGLSVTTLENALVIHALAAPLIFGVLAALYFRAFPAAPVVRTAAIWVGTVVLLDLVVVAGGVEHSLAMFGSPLGTWIPFGLIFGVSVAVGTRVERGLMPSGV